MMKHGQNNRRNRSRGNGKRYPNQRGGAFESSGPDVKVRGTAQQVFEKYLALARDASATGDRIAAESYMQHAEHYYRIINAEQDGRNRPQRPNRGFDEFDDDLDMGDDGQPAQEAVVERQGGQSVGSQSAGGQAHGGNAGGQQAGNQGGNGGNGGEMPGTGEQPDVGPLPIEVEVASEAGAGGHSEGGRRDGNGRGQRGSRRGRPRAQQNAGDAAEPEQTVS